jgi:SAM-dependent methyltransferase
MRFFFNRLTITFLLLCVQVTILRSQNESKDTAYIPSIGQQGKDVVWVPTPDELVNSMLKLAKVTSEDYLIDLGSGDGRTVIAAAKLGARALGIEYNPDMVALSKKNAEKAGVSKNAEFIETDLFGYDLSGASVITMFLLPEINLKLRPKLLDLKPGTRVVSNTFSMGDWESDFEVTTEENWNSWNKAMMWIIPAKVEGVWKLGESELSIKQEFQMIYGNLVSGRKAIPMMDGRLSGSQITFRLGDDLYTGEVDGETMKGSLIKNNSRSEWSASMIR